MNRKNTRLRKNTAAKKKTMRLRKNTAAGKNTAAIAFLTRESLSYLSFTIRALCQSKLFFVFVCVGWLCHIVATELTSYHFAINPTKVVASRKFEGGIPRGCTSPPPPSRYDALWCTASNTDSVYHIIIWSPQSSFPPHTTGNAFVIKGRRTLKFFFLWRYSPNRAFFRSPLLRFLDNTHTITYTHSG